MGPAAVASKEDWGQVAAESEEARLIARSRAGDRAAQELLVRRCQDRVFHLAHSLLDDPEDARDAAQETLIAMLRSLGRFRGDASLQTWLYRLTINICLMQRRRRRSRTRILADTPAEPHEPQTPGLDPQQMVINREAQAAVRQCLRRLPAAFRAIVVLRELGGLSYEEISQVLRVPIGTVKSRLGRARCMLRDLLVADERVSSFCPRGKK